MPSINQSIIYFIIQPDFTVKETKQGHTDNLGEDQVYNSVDYMQHGEYTALAGCKQFATRRCEQCTENNAMGSCKTCSAMQEGGSAMQDSKIARYAQSAAAFTEGRYIYLRMSQLSK